MKDLEISPELFVRNAEHRAFLGRVAGYVFLLFCVVPMVTGLVLPWVFGLTADPYAEVPTRVMLLLATGGLSALLVFLPALLVLRSGSLRRVYVSLLFPLSALCLATQVIMYREFGTEVDTRLIGLFQGNFTALWTFARSEYHLDGALIVLGLVSVGLGLWMSRGGGKKWGPSGKVVTGVTLLIVVAGSLSLAVKPSVARAEHYHPTKLAAAPLYQLVAFFGTHVLGGHSSGYRGILEEAGELTADDYGELTLRLGMEPEEFAQRRVVRPSWLKRQPSHVFLFVMESIEYDLVKNPDLAEVTPWIRKAAREGILTPNFSASSGSTVDAIHATVGGVSAQMHYPVARALERFPLDTLPELMERSGYESVFLAASRRKFGDKGDVCEAYGYNRFTGCPDVAEGIKANEWGVSDGDFYQWAKGELKDLRSPHFVSFLNVSNHAPYDAPLHELGELEFSEAALARFVGQSEEDKVKFAKHMRYADREMGKMAEYLRGLHPDALFVFVGDHTSSKLRADPLQQVPFVLWNDRVVDAGVDASAWYGSHMDILASLANLVLPQGEEFSTLGRPLWCAEEGRVSSSGSLVLSRTGYLSRDGVRRKNFEGLHAVGMEGLRDEEVLLRNSAIKALSWGYINARPLPRKEGSVPETSHSATPEVVRVAP